MSATPTTLPRPALFLLPVAALMLSACGDDPVAVQQPCPGDLVRDAQGNCVAPGTTDTTCDATGVRIEEVFVDPVGDVADEEYQFVELRARAGASMAGLTLRVVSGDGTELATVELRGSADASGLYVVGGSETEPAMDLGAALPRSTGAVRVVDCQGNRVDALAWGTFGDGAFPGEGSPAAAPPEGSSLARCPSATDANDNATDFGLGEPTPGRASAASDFADPSFCGGNTGGCVAGALRGRIRIEEILYNPEGTDAGSEYIELRADPGTAVDGLRVEGVNGDGGRALFAPIVLAGSVGPSGVFVVGGANVRPVDYPLGDVTLQNGPDSIVLYDCDGRSVLDAVAWGSFGADQVSEGEGTPTAAVAEGTSLSRCGDGEDSDDNAADFAAATPTPGAVASAEDFVDPSFCGGGGNPGECVVGRLDVQINEVLYDPAGTDAGSEFIELRGPAGGTVAGAVVVAINGASGAPYGRAIRLSGNFGESGLYVIAGELVGGDAHLPMSLQNGPDSIVVYDCDGETVLDAVGYGRFGEADVFVGEGAPTPGATNGKSISRCAGGTDTGDNASDFGSATATPGSANEGFDDPSFCTLDPTECVPGAAAGLRINEFLANPTGADGDAAAEFVELRGTPNQSLGGLWLAGLNGSNGSAFWGPVRLSGKVAEDGYFVIGQANVAEAQQVLQGALQNGPESIVLYDCDGTTVLDAVAYGSFGATDMSFGEGAPAPIREGRATARCEERPDSDDNSADFGLAEPSPGAPNSSFDDAAFCASVTCEAVPAGAVLINEVLYDPPGSDGVGEAEFIELYAGPLLDLGGMRVEAINGATGAVYLGPIALVGATDADGLFVIGGASVAAADMRLPGALQNGPDSIVLRDCEGTIIDALAYEPHPEGTFPVGEGSPAPAATNTSLGRTGGRDTDDNSVDFTVQASPSPGAPN